ncbi:MAG: Trk system potassium transporter TrkA [Ruminococcaceae bacterium]|nr:Trk system potassium transporter TrkA [Oscillospiraceae bacterium]
MNIIIAGCGNIGTSVLESLVTEGHNVTVIDKDPKIIETASTAFDTMGVVGNAADSDALQEAGIGTCDLFVSVTGSDEFNMLSCYLAKRLGAAHTIARIRAPEYNDHSLTFMRNELELDMSINPEMQSAMELFNILKLPGALNIETFANRRMEMVEIPIKDDIQFTLTELRKKINQDFLICAIERDGNVIIPDGRSVIRKGDRIRLTASPFTIQKLLKHFGIETKQAKNVMIIGASQTSYYLAKMLLNSGHNVKIVERDAEKCLKFSEQLPKAVVINGDGLDQDLLTEEGILSMDSFISLTSSDEENILLSFFALSNCVRKVITTVSRPELASMAENLGLDSIVSPKKLISDILTRYARALDNSKGSNVEKLYKIIDGKAEALEFNVKKDFEGLNLPIKELKLKKNVLIAGIIRGRQGIIPTGDDCFKANDKVIIIAAGIKMNDLSDIFA